MSPDRMPCLEEVNHSAGAWVGFSSSQGLVVGCSIASQLNRKAVHQCPCSGLTFLSAMR